VVKQRLDLMRRIGGAGQAPCFVVVGQEVVDLRQERFEPLQPGVVLGHDHVDHGHNATLRQYASSSANSSAWTAGRANSPPR